jgi:hypothetical protein
MSLSGKGRVFCSGWNYIHILWLRRYSHQYTQNKRESQNEIINFTYNYDKNPPEYSNITLSVPPSAKLKDDGQSQKS